MDILQIQSNPNRQFLNIIEKRIRKNLRSKDILHKDQTIYVIDQLTIFFLKRIVTLPVNIVQLSKKELNIKEYNCSIFSNKEIRVFIKKMKKNEILFLPLSLRLFRTSWPFLFLFRSRKPCVLTRFNFLGW